ncbi:MAG: transcriptional repressor LexA [Thermodesulfobacteriota bacterium]
MGLMVDDTVTKSRAALLADFHDNTGRMPSFSEMRSLWKLKSNNAVSKVVDKLVVAGAVEKDNTGRLIPRSLSHAARLLGSVEAGFPSPAEEELADTISLDEMLIKDKTASFLLKVSGDSMIEAGILPEDMVIVNKGMSPKNGDIVIAQVDGEWTMKYLNKKGGALTLVPANPKYKPITPKNELTIAGVVTAVIRKYR